MGDLTKNFDKAEFACKCCGTDGIDQKLVSALQELRELVNKPITVNSAYRCPVHNKAIGGSKNSQHMLGTAADIVIHVMTVSEMAHQAEQIDSFHNGGIGTYPARGFIHVDVRGHKSRWVG